MISAKFLNESKAMKRLFDAVLGSTLFEHARQDVPTLIRKLDAFAEAVSDIEIAR